MKIEKGKHYVTRCGAVVGPMRPHNVGSFVWAGDFDPRTVPEDAGANITLTGYVYTYDGLNYDNIMKGIESEWDIVGIHDEASRDELKPEFVTMVIEDNYGKVKISPSVSSLDSRAYVYIDDDLSIEDLENVIYTLTALKEGLEKPIRR